jgi:hypothetical protein
MSTSILIRLGGLSVLLGGLLWGMQKIGWPLFLGGQDPRTYPQPAATVLWVMGLVAALLVLIGLPALYARQAVQAGRLGLIAFVLVFIGMALVTGNAYFGTFIQSGLVDLIVLAEGAGVTVQEPAAAAAGFMIALLLYLLGWIMFGLASLRARVLPRGAVSLVIAGIVLGIVFMATGILWLGVPAIELGFAWLGFALWRERGAVLVEPVTAT